MPTPENDCYWPSLLSESIFYISYKTHYIPSVSLLIHLSSLLCTDEPRGAPVQLTVTCTSLWLQILNFLLTEQFGLEFEETANLVNRQVEPSQYNKSFGLFLG